MAMSYFTSMHAISTFTVRRASLPILILVAACGGSALPDGVPTNTTHMEGAELYHFSTLAEMTEASDLIFVGTVEDILPFKLNEGTEDDPGLQLVSIVTGIDEILKGEAKETATFAWNGWDVAVDGTVGPRLVIDGVDIPVPGQQYLLFLFELTDEERTQPDYPEYGLISRDGILSVKGDVLSTDADGDRLAYELVKLSLADIASEVRAQPSD